MAQFFAQGTTTVEVKSGYGLTTKDEIKTLEAIALLQVSIVGVFYRFSICIMYCDLYR
jgi:imidazolonepropionase-like amidohydrolase